MIDDIKKERLKFLQYKNIKPVRDKLFQLNDIEDIEIKFGNTVNITSNKISKNEQNIINSIAKELKPWRKGPFQLFDTFIDSEWQSFIKYNLLKPHFNLKNKTVADIGCNNGYYMFRMLEQKPKKIVGFDPSPLFKTQFDLINHFVKSDIVYELLGVEHLEMYGEKFDTIFCLGVLYHRGDPIATVKILKKSLKPNGELFLDTFIIDGDEEVALTPKDRYSKIPNIYFIPTISALKNWLFRAGFKTIDIIAIEKTDLEEQRKTKWIDSESLENFLDPDDSNKTIEGYPAPKRAYIKASLNKSDIEKNR